MNINLFLQNSHRRDVFGGEMASKGWPQIKDKSVFPLDKWTKPEFGMTSEFGLGHETNISDIITLKIYNGDKELGFEVMRNQWTPAWMKTHYRSTVDKEYYPNAGCVCVRETKCILHDNSFISEVMITNERREKCTYTVEIVTPLPKVSDGLYNFNAETVVGGLQKTYHIDGYMTINNTVSSERTFQVTLKPFEQKTFRYYMIYNPDGMALDATERLIGSVDPFEKNEVDFNNWFVENVPELKIENMDILKAYYYRWYLVWRGIHTPQRVIPEHDVKGFCIYESPFGEWFGCPIGLPIPMQVEEAKWMKNAYAAKGQIENWVGGVQTYQWYIQFTVFAIWEFYCLHPDEKWLAEIYYELKKYALKDIDIDNPTLPVTEGSWLTGAEYQPSFYQYTEPNWDWRQDDEGIRNGLKFEKPKLHRLDAAVYTILNLQGCAMAAKELGKESDYELLCNIAEQFTRQIEEEHWDKQKKMFYDIDLKTGKRCDVSACYDSFAPFMWGIVGEKYFDSINSIFDRNKFWGDFAVSTVEKCNPMYWFDNCIAGPVESSVLSPHHYSASWNGPVWPYANSLVAVALGSVAEQDKRFKAGFLDFFGKWTDLHFLDGDRSVPMTHEHYRQSDGASFSNVVDYFHSSWINPFMTYWAGIRLENGELIFEPLTEEEFSLHGVNIRGKSYNFSQHRENDILKRVMEICK